MSRNHFVRSLVHLLEADILGVLMEALTAHVQSVFADQTVTVAAEERGSEQQVKQHVKLESRWLKSIDHNLGS